MSSMVKGREPVESKIVCKISRLCGEPRRAARPRLHTSSRLSIPSFVYSHVCSYPHLSIPSFVHSLVHPSLRPYIPMFRLPNVNPRVPSLHSSISTFVYPHVRSSLCAMCNVLCAMCILTPHVVASPFSHPPYSSISTRPCIGASLVPCVPIFVHTTR